MAWKEAKRREVTPSEIYSYLPRAGWVFRKASQNVQVKESNMSAGKGIDSQKPSPNLLEIIIPGNRTTHTKGNSTLQDTQDKVTLAQLVSSRPSQEGIEFKRELEGGHLPNQELCQPTPECSAPCHIPVNLITAKLQSNYNEHFQGGEEGAA